MRIGTPMSDELSRYLDLSDRQLQLTAENMANVDTPGYRARGIDFSAEMERSIAEVRRSRRDADGPSLPAASPRTLEVDGLLERPDGNDVSMDREGLNMAEEQLQFRAGTELLKREFTRISDAIHVDK